MLLYWLYYSLNVLMYVFFQGSSVTCACDCVLKPFKASVSAYGTMLLPRKVSALGIDFLMLKECTWKLHGQKIDYACLLECETRNGTVRSIFLVMMLLDYAQSCILLLNNQQTNKTISGCQRELSPNLLSKKDFNWKKIIKVISDSCEPQQKGACRKGVLHSLIKNSLDS